MNYMEILDIVIRTFQVAITGVLVIAGPGIFLGYLLARWNFRGKSLVETLVALPMVLPPVAVGLLLLFLFSRNRPFGDFLTEKLGWQIVYTWVAAAIAAAVVSFPLLVRACQQAFSDVPQRLEQVAESLGSGRVRRFFTVSFPLARQGVIYGLLLAFCRALGEFGATTMIAGNIPGKTQTLALGIYSSVINNRDREAFVLMIISVVIAFAAMYFSEGYVKKAVKK
ncbi:MAG: molybdate ABC transporter permease subunit [Dehalococcoidia bacterium]|nr:molybdate ABC transporter permease subunit [Dehalococcoidia bacterium]MDZ4247342.1 molybdate ABC transporter permease subunit [Dehalococcoidia bacterium]